MYWKELFDDYRKEFPNTPFWMALVIVTYASIVIPVLAWFDCDFRIFRFKMRLAVRALIIRIIKGA